MHSLTNNLPRTLVFMLGAGMTMLAGNSLLDLVFAASPVRKNSSALRPLPPAAHTQTGKVNIDDYIMVLPNRFCGHTNPAKRPRTARKAGLQATFVLRGTALHSDPAQSCAFIEVPGATEQKVYRQGDSVHGAQILAIGQDFVKLKKGKETIKLAISYEETQALGFNSPNGNGGAPPAGDQAIQAMLQKLPASLRRLLDKTTPEQKRQLLRLPPAERMKVLRKYLKKQQAEARAKRQQNAWKQKNKKKKNPRRDM